MSFFFFFNVKDVIFFGLLPIQVAPMLGEEPSLLEDLVDAVLRREEFKLLLQNQKDQTAVDHDGKCYFIIPLQVFFPPVFFSLPWQKVSCIYSLKLKKYQWVYAKTAFHIPLLFVK